MIHAAIRLLRQLRKGKEAEAYNASMGKGWGHEDGPDTVYLAQPQEGGGAAIGPTYSAYS